MKEEILRTRLDADVADRLVSVSDQGIDRSACHVIAQHRQLIALAQHVIDLLVTDDGGIHTRPDRVRELADHWQFVISSHFDLHLGT